MTFEPMRGSKIIRQPNCAKGGITADERKLMDEHAKLWIARAMRTDPIDPEMIVPAIHELYAAADLPKPRVVIVPSPMVGAFAYGAAAAIWHVRNTDAATRAATDAATEAATYAATSAATDAATSAATRAATEAATRAATSAATDAATYAATRAATEAATRAATRAATEAATRAATDAATEAATRAATDAATEAATDAATEAATSAATACHDIAGDLGLSCARQWYRSYQGGNMWAGYDCYLTAARDILLLKLPEHEKYRTWEACAIHGGFRFMHAEFCIVSDFPEVLRTDEQHRPHCETGPSHRWRDGWSLYHWHGTQIPAEWIEDRASLTPKIALSWGNADQRAAAIQIIGWARLVEEMEAVVIDRHPEGMEGGELLAIKKSAIADGQTGVLKLLRAECPRNGTICFRVPDTINTAHEAQAWSRGLPPDLFKLPSTRT